MPSVPTVLWVIGPPASGKSHLLSQLSQRFPQVIDQDRLLESQLAAAGIPLDFRLHDESVAEQVRRFREQASHQTWANAPVWRRSRADFAVETTGDKPDSLAKEIAADRQFGYRDMAICLSCPLEVCLDRNQSRQRVLPEAVVSTAWTVFHRHLSQGTYHAILGESSMIDMRSLGSI